MSLLLSMLHQARVHFEFSNWPSLILILSLVLGLMAWITYVALSIRSLKKGMRNMVTKSELAQEFRKFKAELSGNA